MNQITVTISIPVFNGEKFFKEAIDSVLAQSRQPDEILIVNNNFQTTLYFNRLQSFFVNKLISLNLLNQS